MSTAFMIFAGLFGLAGVALSAIAAHAAGAANLGTAAQFLLFHAPALLGLALALHVRLGPSPLLLAAGGALVLGVSLFCGDLACRHVLGHGLFPMAAPSGGSLTMLGWLLLAIAGLMARTTPQG